MKFKNLRIRKLIISAVLAWSLLRSSKSASLDSLNQKQNNSVVHERVIKNEFNSLDDSNTSGRIIETGTGTILTQKDHESSLNMDEVILVKDDGILPGADAYIPKNNPSRRYPFGRSRMRGPKSTDVFSPEKISFVPDQYFRQVRTNRTLNLFLGWLIRLWLTLLSDSRKVELNSNFLLK